MNENIKGIRDVTVGSGRLFEVYDFLCNLFLELQALNDERVLELLEKYEVRVE